MELMYYFHDGEFPAYAARRDARKNVLRPGAEIKGVPLPEIGL